MRIASVLAFLCLLSPVRAAERVMTLREAVDLAARQNPDVVLARLEEQRAALGIQAVREPGLPRLFVGSGLAYSSGMPMSIEGSTPAVVQARAVRTLWNRPQGYHAAQARESARGAAAAAAAAREDAALRVASLFLDLERAVRQAEAVQRQVEHLQKIEAAARLRAEEGRDAPIEARRAALETARARLRLQQLASQRRAASMALAAALGLDPSEEIVPAREERPAPPLPLEEDASVAEALRDDPEIRRLEAEIAARHLEARSWRAMRLPRIDLVAQYGLLAKFNNYEKFFNRFERHNGQLGASIQIPIFSSSQDEARASQAEIEARRLRTQLQDLRRRIESDTRAAWQKVRDAEAARELARMDLDLAREQVSSVLAQVEEGRASLRQLEQARFEEQERWILYYNAVYDLELARLELMRRTHALLASLP
ncbi:MAG: TolC family protein [Bryobacteraceae bacterium]|nr:TolC family protein [Bryobacteraceae bacterium]